MPSSPACLRGSTALAKLSYAGPQWGLAPSLKVAQPLLAWRKRLQARRRVSAGLMQDVCLAAKPTEAIEAVPQAPLRGLDIDQAPPAAAAAGAAAAGGFTRGCRTLQQSVKSPIATPSAQWAALGPKINVAAAQHQGAKEFQEDRFLCVDLPPRRSRSRSSSSRSSSSRRRSSSSSSSTLMAGVFDGHGGHLTAEHAKLYLPTHIAQGLLMQKGAAAAGLKIGFRLFDRWWENAACDPSVTPEGMDRSGATAVVGLVQGDLLTVANAGDSHAFLVGVDGSSQLLSTPHDLTNEDEVARVLAAGGHILTKKGRKPRLYNKAIPYFGDVGSLVTRGFGDSSHKAPNPIMVSEPDVVQRRLDRAQDMALVMTSDGVTDVMGAERVGTVVQAALKAARSRNSDQHAAAAAAAEAVVHEAVQLGSGDNITATVMLFDWGE